MTEISRPVKRTLLLSYFEGAAVAVHNSYTIGLYPIAFALMLGASDFQIGILGAFSFLATLFGFLSAYLVEATGQRKWTTVWTGFISRSIWVLAPAIPMIAVGSSDKAWLFVFLVGISLAAGSMSGNAWLAWFTDLVPAEIRGRYFGKRSGLLSAVGLAGSLGAGLFLDHYRRANSEYQGYAILFVLAFALALVSLVLFFFHYEGKRPTAKGFGRASSALLRPFANKDYRVFLLYFVIWGFVNGLSSPFWGAHMFKNLGMTYTQVALYSSIAGVCVFFSHFLWGWIIDRVGARAVLKFCSLGVVITPLLWPFASRTNLIPIWIDAALSGGFWPGVNLAALYLLMENRGESGDSAVAIYSFATGLAAFLTSLLGSWLTVVLAGLHFQGYGVLINNFTALFVATGIMRLFVLAFMPRFAEPKRASARVVPREVLAFLWVAALTSKEKLLWVVGRMRGHEHE
ncbi:MAG: MFS transporter [candidate division WOR-3 bacterium]